MIIIIIENEIEKMVTTFEVTDDYNPYPAVDKFFIDVEIYSTGDKKIWLYSKLSWAKMDITSDFKDQDLSNVEKLNELVQNNLTEFCHFFVGKCCCDEEGGV